MDRGLKFNPSKCEFVIIGAKRTNIDLDLYLYGDKKIKRSERIKVLGLVIESQKANPFGKMVKEAKRNMQFMHLRIRTLFNIPTYKLMTNLYWTLIVAKSLYASESWNTEIIPCDSMGRITNWIKKDDGTMINYESSPVAKKGLTIYKLMFGTVAVMREIQKLRKKGIMRNRYQLPLTPGHYAVYKDMCLILDIITGENNLETDDFLIANNGSRNTRQGGQSAWAVNVKNRRAHHRELSIIRRHEAFVDFIINCQVSMLELYAMTRDQRKEKLRRMIDLVPTHDNFIRGQIWDGTFRLQQYN